MLSMDGSLFLQTNINPLSCSSISSFFLYYIHTSFSSHISMSVTSNAKLLEKYMSLDQHNAVQVEYVWIDGFNNLRSKTKTVYKVPQSAADLSEWNYDGSSTGQAEGHDSDVLIQPVALFADPFRGGNNKIVLCETFNPGMYNTISMSCIIQSLIFLSLYTRWHSSPNQLSQCMQKDHGCSC